MDTQRKEQEGFFAESFMKDRARKILYEVSHIDPVTMELKKESRHYGCPFCNIDDGDFVDTYQTKQALFYRFKKCRKCSLIYPSPRPNKDIIENVFRSVELSKISQLQGGLVAERTRENNKISFWRRIPKYCANNLMLGHRYQDFTKYAKKGLRVLNIGAGLGHMSKKLIKKGCIVEAVELNPYRAKYLREELGIKVYDGSFVDVDIPANSYDMVVMSQVLMHIFLLKDFMDKIYYVLRPGGRLISSQMNFNSIIQQTVRAPHPGSLNAFTICSWFTPESLKNIVEMSGFKTEAIEYRPTGLFEHLFVEGYPGGLADKMLLKFIDQIIALVLMRTKTTDYFTIVAKKAAD